MRQIISAFKYIHSQKIIHRDIKLDNVLVNFETEQDKQNLNMMKATVKIIDFGFACQISKKGLQYSTLGSPINMDPIILKKLNSTGKKARQLGYDLKADIWSLCTICYEMLIGKSAFDAEDMDELVSKIEDGTYTVGKEINSFETQDAIIFRTNSGYKFSFFVTNNTYFNSQSSIYNYSGN